MEKVIVTGGLGFIGSHLVEKLFTMDSVKKITVIDDMSTSVIRPLAEWEEESGGRSFFHGHWDISTVPQKFLDNIFADYDTVFHLAAVSRTVPACQDPIRCHNSNATGTMKVLEAARQSKLKRLVLTSSNVALAGATPYRATKRYMEDLCQVYAELYDVNVMALRLSNTYGPRLTPPACFAALKESKERNGYLEITGDGTQKRIFTHVKDVVEAFILAAQTSGYHANYRGVVDICSDEECTLNDIAKYFNCEVRYVADRPGDVPSIPQNNRHAWNALGWVPTIKLADGIKDCL